MAKRHNIKYKETGAFLKALRINKDILKEALAAKAEIHPQTVTNWESGKCFVPLKHAHKVFEVLGMNKKAHKDLMICIAMDREIHLLKKLKDAKA